MGKLYSKTTGGFYDREIHGINIPADAVEITDELHAALLDAQASGNRIEGDAGGNPVVVTPAPEQPAAPAVVSMRQARLALLAAGMLQPVNDAIAALPGADGDAARIEWEYATEVRRDSQIVQRLASALALDVDALFAAAAAL